MQHKKVPEGPKSDSKNGTAGFVSTIMPEVTVNELKFGTIKPGKTVTGVVIGGKPEEELMITRGGRSGGIIL